MINFIGYHCTSKENWKKIKAQGLKGSAWTEDISILKTMNSNPFRLSSQGAVWCYESLMTAQENKEEDEVILKITGQGLKVTHEAHGVCLVGKANLCQASLVRKNAK